MNSDGKNRTGGEEANRGGEGMGEERERRGAEVRRSDQ